jgi:hypothetical protein
MKGLVLLMALLLGGCAPALSLRPAEPPREGLYTVIFYGGRFLDDPESLVLLDAQGDGYHLRPFAPEFEYYSSKEPLHASQAMKAAGHFLGMNPFFKRLAARAILSPDGGLIGYELRPLLSPLRHGMADVLQSRYVLGKRGEVKVYIRLKPQLRDNQPLLRP